MAAKRPKVHIGTVEELLGAPVEKGATTEIRIDSIYPFENHPFKVRDDEKMQDLVQSINDNGVLVPVLVRPDDEGTYEMISGHRRMHAAKLAGLETIPAIIKEMTNDEAIIAMVDSNLQREEILPSERAFSLKMKLEAIRRQGRRNDLNPTSGTEFLKLEKGPGDAQTRDSIGKEAGITGRQVTKYIRLTELIPELLDLVDQKRIPIALGVEISYLDRKVQEYLYKYFSENGVIFKEQVAALREQPDPEVMTENLAFQIMNVHTPQVKDTGKVNFSRKKLDEYFPKEYSSAKREEIILSLLSSWKKEREGNDIV
jgi:ParB family chromosome partitioning protein